MRLCYGSRAEEEERRRGRGQLLTRLRTEAGVCSCMENTKVGRGFWAFEANIGYAPIIHLTLAGRRCTKSEH